MLWGTALHEQVPEEALSRVASLDALGGYLFLPVSSAFTGLAVAGTGLTSVVIVCCCVLVLSTFLPLFVGGVAQFAPPDT